MERYICIHAHFYQPPRENAWLEAVELQDSAYPYHDWNERVTAECYAPNSASRILDGDGRILQIVNNYSKISFNFGPTLLSWMEQKSPAVYQAILAADRESQRLFSGHGSAVAQAYNHMILPLAEPAGQVHANSLGDSGLRKPVWPASGRNVAAGNRGGFANAGSAGGTGNQVHDSFSLPGRTSAAARRTGLAQSGWRKNRSLDGLCGAGSLRTDDECVFSTTGRFHAPLPSRMFWAMGSDSPTGFWEHFPTRAPGPNWFTSPPTARLTDITSLRRYGSGICLELYRVQPTGAAHQLRGVSGEASADPGSQGDRKQLVELRAWRGTLEERLRLQFRRPLGMEPAMESAAAAGLRLAARYGGSSLREPKPEKLFEHPWQTRDAYIGVVLDRSRENVMRFMTEQAKRKLSESEIVTGLKLLELQRYLMLMYTSCGWFFDDLSGLETVQVIQYAGRALQLAGQLFSEDLATPFLDLLAQAHSNLPEQGDGRAIYERYVQPAMVDLEKVGAHYAVSSLFEEYGESHANLLLRRWTDGIPFVAPGKIASGLGTGQGDFRNYLGVGPDYIRRAASGGP